MSRRVKWFSECVAPMFSFQSLRILNGLTKSNKSKVFSFLSLSLSLYFSQLYILNSRKCANGLSRQARRQSVSLPASQPAIHFNQFVYTLWLIQIIVSKSNTNSPSPIKIDHVTVFNLSSNSIIYLFISFWGGRRGFVTIS